MTLRPTSARSRQDGDLLGCGELPGAVLACSLLESKGGSGSHGKGWL